MELTVIDHPLSAVRLGIMRDKHSSNAAFRMALRDLTQFLMYEASRSIPTDSITIDTPVTQTLAQIITQPPLLVPVLRAGLGMVDQAHSLLPEASIGFVGLARDEETFAPRVYFQSLPDDLSSTQVFVLDPMLATGGSMSSTVELLTQRGAKNITVICIIAAPEGVKAVEALPTVSRLFLVALDEKLNEQAYIYPGLGDAGDRQFGPR